MDRRLESLDSAVDYLAKAQHPSGVWSDFWLKAGTADAWVTAYTGVLLWDAAVYLNPKSARLARDCARAAADWLGANIGAQASWGYNKTTPPDADSTAWAVLLLTRLNQSIPADTVAFLLAHQTDAGLFQTYRFHPTGHRWAQPCVDVSLSVAIALLTAQVWSKRDTLAYWQTAIAPRQTATGQFIGYWWEHPHFPTWLAWRLWQQLDRPALAHDWPQISIHTAEEIPFLAACSSLNGPSKAVFSRLRQQQQVDGSWPSAPILRVPPSHDGLMQQRPQLNCDARRIFTTVTVLAAIAPYAVLMEDKPGCEASGKAVIEKAVIEKAVAAVDYATQTRQRSAYGEHCDQLISRVGKLCGFSHQQSVEAVRHFQCLTQQSLAQPNSWPAAQLSALSMGQPLEFSVTADADLAQGAARSLRYTCEIGNPILPTPEQVKTGLSTLEQAAAQLGCAAPWQRLSPVWKTLVSGAVRLSGQNRFRLWAGISQSARTRPVLKVYINPLLADSKDSQAGLQLILAAAGIPYTGELQWLCNHLRTVGFPQEIGFGLQGDGQWGVKIYYEFFGWRPSLITQISTELGFPAALPQLTPTIPGVFSEALAKKRRSGLSFRIHPSQGRVLELTTTAAFPLQLIPAAATHERISMWLQAQQQNADSYDQLYSDLFPSPVAAQHRRFSLLTRTVDLAGAAKSTLYLRPVIQTSVRA